MVKVSVVVPVYNVEQYLDKCLQSLIKQDFDNYEIIVVNDGSPDKSQKIIDKYMKKYPKKVKGFKKENGGLSSARNYGLDKSNGEYIVFVDSDDYVSKNYISLLYNKAVSTDSDIVICDMYKTFDDRKEVMLGIRKITNDNIRNAIISLPAAWNKIYRKSLFIDNDIYYPDKLYYEDLATTFRLIMKANKIEYVNEALYYYVQRDNSIMNQVKYNKKNCDVFEVLDILKNFVIKEGYYQEYFEEIEYLYISHLLHDFSLRVYRYEEGKNDIIKALGVIKDNCKNIRKNKYFKMESIKYKIVCYLIYFNRIDILKLILK